MLYLHIPYCRRKCSYCAFYSRPRASVEDCYIEALCKEISLRCHELSDSNEQRHTLRTIYIGGGTPSLLSPAQLQTLQACIAQHFDLSRVEEVTLECNPESLTTDYLQTLKAMGFVDRLSIGIQSFDDDTLRRINRLHNGSQAIRAVETARHNGFDNISIDLIYGLPGQSNEQWQHNLSLLETLRPEHLSCYSLTVEPDSMLQKQITQGSVPPPIESEALQQYDMLLSWTAAHGYEQYEISNFCRPGRQSCHHSRYWTRTPYLGCGAAAHSFDGKHRRWNPADTELYIKSMALDVCYEEENLTATDQYNETIMLGLRTTAGIAKEFIDTKWRTQLHNALQPFILNGLIKETATHYRPTSEGLLHADGIRGKLFRTKWLEGSVRRACICRYIKQVRRTKVRLAL